MARSIDDIGLAATSRKFSCELGHDVSKNTLKSIQKSYHKQVRETGDPTKIKTLPKGAQGRPTMLPSRIDGQVLRYVQALRENGAAVNRRITLAAAVGIVRTIQPSLLAEHGGSLTLRTHGQSPFYGAKTTSSARQRKPPRSSRKTLRSYAKGFTTVLLKWSWSIRCLLS